MQASTSLMKSRGDPAETHGKNVTLSHKYVVFFQCDRSNADCKVLIAQLQNFRSYKRSEA